MIVPLVYVWQSHQCMVVPPVYGCPTSVWLSHRCMVFPPVYVFSAGVWLSYWCMAVYMCMVVLHVYGCPSSVQVALCKTPIRFCTTCPKGVGLYYQCLYNLSWCMVVLSMFVKKIRTMYGFPYSVIQPVRTVYDCPTSAGTTCPNTVLLSYQCLYSLSEQCIVVLPVLV